MFTVKNFGYSLSDEGVAVTTDQEAFVITDPALRKLLCHLTEHKIEIFSDIDERILNFFTSLCEFQKAIDFMENELGIITSKNQFTNIYFQDFSERICLKIVDLFPTWKMLRDKETLENGQGSLIHFIFDTTPTCEEFYETFHRAPNAALTSFSLPISGQYVLTAPWEKTLKAPCPRCIFNYVSDRSYRNTSHKIDTLSTLSDLIHQNGFVNDFEFRASTRQILFALSLVDARISKMNGSLTPTFENKDLINSVLISDDLINNTFFRAPFSPNCDCISS